jgi:hypothetical protein
MSLERFTRDLRRKLEARPALRQTRDGFSHRTARSSISREEIKILRPRQSQASVGWTDVIAGHRIRMAGREATHFLAQSKRTRSAEPSVRWPRLSSDKAEGKNAE